MGEIVSCFYEIYPYETQYPILLHGHTILSVCHRAWENEENGLAGVVEWSI